MKISFIELLKQFRITIPVIQRDYAQGRNESKVQKIRHDFLENLFETIKRKYVDNTSPCLELDFIYGTFYKNLDESLDFYPLDGQQRLTTLWLLHWFVASKENKIKDAKQFLERFGYQTRHSSQVFCEQIANFQPSFEYENISEEILDQSWYFASWEFDPTIISMLNMLKDIERKYVELDSTEIWDVLNNENAPFIFYQLDTEKLGLPDDLYIKMNSRGKALTEFEYFKSYFSELIEHSVTRKEFDDKIDQSWLECIWSFCGNKNHTDLALLADSYFLRLVNYITDIIAAKTNLPFISIEESPELLKEIYMDEDNVKYLIDVMDTITENLEGDTRFWNNFFYYNRDGYQDGKVRWFGYDYNFLENCLKHFSKYNYEQYHNTFSLQERVMLYCCLTHLLHNSEDFEQRIRVVRNLVVNSLNELRDKHFGEILLQVEGIILHGDLEQVSRFKTDQINEEKEKRRYSSERPEIYSAMCKLEDNRLIRGCLSVFMFDDNFVSRAETFLNIFNESDWDFNLIGNAFLTIGDYGQDNSQWTNLGNYKESVWHDLLTTPGYNKLQFNSRTKPVLNEFLIYCFEHKISLEDMVSGYISNTPIKDWRYYFLKYENFRQNCNQGYYAWYAENENQYQFYKMKERQFNGAYWCPFLQAVNEKLNTKVDNLQFDDVRLKVIWNDYILEIEKVETGFQIQITAYDGEMLNVIKNILIDKGIIETSGIYQIHQNELNIDLKDRIEEGAKFVIVLIDALKKIE